MSEAEPSLETVRQALEREPERLDLYAKLLEIHAARGEVDPFFAAALKVMALTRGAGPAWDRARVLGRQINPGNRLYMDDPPAARWFHPAWRDCAIYSLSRFLGLYVVAAVIVFIADFGEWRRLFRDLFQVLAVFGGLALFAALLMHGGAVLCRWSIEAGGLRGRDFWGRRRFIAWDDVGEIAHATIEDWPMFKVRSASSRREVWVATAGVNVWDVHTQLCRSAGPEHPLTAWYRQAFFAPLD